MADAIGRPPVLAAALITATVLIGSTLHVKSLIRERHNPAYARTSRACALATPVLVAIVCSATGIPWWPVAPFVLLIARVRWAHLPAWRPARIGMIELAGLLSVAAAGFPHPVVHSALSRR
ncbi:hypothetical protein [Amycolatopsis sp. NPDC059657]|uniref:hypothetical protein n=1 Tax=Amycolatopsis sp. NPDC059657 TaxID=3346899 RepID=UPI00366F0BC1